jgi:hypothetical protein
MLKTAFTFISTIQFNSEYEKSINVFLKPFSVSDIFWKKKKIQINNQYISVSKGEKGEGEPKPTPMVNVFFFSFFFFFFKIYHLLPRFFFQVVSDIHQN